MSFSQNAEIFNEGDPAIHIYKIVSGSVRTCRMLPDGRRQIADFHLPGDIFELGLHPEQSLTAEAIDEATVLAFRRAEVIELADRDKDAAQHLWRLAMHQLQRVQKHALLLGKNAQERVAAFLLEMSARMPPGDVVNLPMSRQDIADYLGLTIETVSRTLTQLGNDAAIELATSRRIVLRDRNSLNRLNG
jgi:CRP/FNR family nitrogen fixation transcriptional regulator